MTIPWLHRPPTPEEVAAHAAAVPSHLNARRASKQVMYGLWLRSIPGLAASLEDLGTTNNKQRVYDSIGCPVSPEDAGIRGARFLPCTADGIPVCLLEAT